jgi:hypothetical protein
VGDKVSGKDTGGRAAPILAGNSSPCNTAPRHPSDQTTPENNGRVFVRSVEAYYGVRVSVGLGVGLSVGVTVGVTVGVEVLVGVGVMVKVGVGVGVGVGRLSTM